MIQLLVNLMYALMEKDLIQIPSYALTHLNMLRHKVIILVKMGINLMVVNVQKNWFLMRDLNRHAKKVIQ